MALDTTRILTPLIVGYLLGGIPWSLVVGKRFFGIDPREHGSGNLGATNVYRSVGLGAALVVLALDIAKGALSVVVGMLFCPPKVTGDARDWLLIGVAMAAVLGHMYSPYIRFRGGKGVATAAGAIAVVMPLTWPIMFVTFAVVVAVWRMVSLGSIVVAVEYPILVAALYPHRSAFQVFSLAAAALVILRHRANIVRIYRGEESRISWKPHGDAADRDAEE